MRHEWEEQDRTSDLEEWRHEREEQDRAYAESLQNDHKKEDEVARTEEVRWSRMLELAKAMQS